MFFSFFELIGGFLTGSVAIISDSVHDIGDAASIGISYLLEKKSKKEPDNKFTYGYSRYSVIGSIITTLILLIGSVAVIFNAISKIINPNEIHYTGMIIFAVIGVLVNLVAAIITREGDSLNQRAVSLHMLEDVLGWVVVLIGAIVMKNTDFALLDPIMSICVALFIFVCAYKNLKNALGVFLEKAPDNINIEKLKKHITKIDGVIDLHHIHIWSIDGENAYATMHVVFNGESHKIKEKVREELREHGIAHATLELETEGEHCDEMNCAPPEQCGAHHHHHHYHHQH